MRPPGHGRCGKPCLAAARHDERPASKPRHAGGETYEWLRTARGSAGRAVARAATAAADPDKRGCAAWAGFPSRRASAPRAVQQAGSCTTRQGRKATTEAAYGGDNQQLDGEREEGAGASRASRRAPTRRPADPKATTPQRASEGQKPRGERKRPRRSSTGARRQQGPRHHPIPIPSHPIRNPSQPNPQPPPASAALLLLALASAASAPAPAPMPRLNSQILDPPLARCPPKHPPCPNGSPPPPPQPDRPSTSRRQTNPLRWVAAPPSCRLMTRSQL